MAVPGRVGMPGPMTRLFRKESEPMRDAIRATRWRLGPILLACAASGCAAVPRGQIEDCRQQTLALHAELSQTKDLAANLRTQNREMAARSVEDARRLAALEESNERLER